MSSARAAAIEPGRLTQGSISRNVIAMAAPIAIGMLFQTLYVLIDLYFVGRLGDAAIAGVSTASNVMFLIMALTQALSVGTVALIAQAIGRRDRDDANLVFNQSLSIAVVLTVATLVVGYAFTPAYMASVGADAATEAAGRIYLWWYLPGLALQFALVSMGAALRGTGIVKPAMVVQVLTIVLNAVLAPVLIAGWGTGRPLGVAGAGLASTLAIAFGVVLLGFYFHRLEHDVAFDRELAKPRLGAWRRILRIGTPAGAEILMMFVIMGTVYVAIRAFGADAQAGFGIGNRVNQALFLPVMAVAFAVAPVAGQNFGAGLHDRVRETFRIVAWLCSVLMIAMTALCHWQPEAMVRLFTNDAEVTDVGVQFLRVVSWNYVAIGLIFTSSGMFQALGNTLPSLLSSATRLATFVAPVLWLSRRPGFELLDVWRLSVATTLLQAALGLWLLRREMRARLRQADATG